MWSIVIRNNIYDEMNKKGWYNLQCQMEERFTGKWSEKQKMS